MPPVRASLVMPTLNAGPLLDRVLAGLDAQRGETLAQRIAIDSGSTDGTQQRLERAGFAVTTIDKRNFDHGSTRDLGIGKTDCDVVVLLTQDAVPLGSDWLAGMVRPFADDRVAAVWCKQVPRPDCPPVIARRIKQWLGDGTQARVQELRAGETLEDLAPLERLNRCALDNVASALRRSVWERFPLGPRRFGEDLAFGMRVIAAGHRVVFEPRAVVEHSHSRTPFAEGKRTFCDHRNLREMVGLVAIPDWRPCAPRCATAPRNTSRSWSRSIYRPQSVTARYGGRANTCAGSVWGSTSAPRRARTRRGCAVGCSRGWANGSNAASAEGLLHLPYPSRPRKPRQHFASGARLPVRVAGVADIGLIVMLVVPCPRMQR